MHTCNIGIYKKKYYIYSVCVNDTQYVVFYLNNCQLLSKNLVGNRQFFFFFHIDKLLKDILCTAFFTISCFNLFIIRFVNSLLLL